MGFIDFHQGCGSIPTCFGPREGYYTIFNTPLHLSLIFHLIPALIIGLLCFVLLAILRRKGRQIPKPAIYFAPLILTVALYFVLAYTFPMIIMY
ncbi:MAG: hypothetical protein HY518_03370 [Candidatus Aenigmarchaeota archaeon]|nr:hypothetical protein [Candidatus Aenigmarchaeota archaeon]